MGDKMGFKTIYIEETNEISLYLNNLKLKIEEEDVLIPLADIEILLIDNIKCFLSSQLLIKLVEFKVGVILCGLNHMPLFTLLPLHGHFAQTGRLHEQLNWKIDRKLQLHKMIVMNKIKNQLKILVNLGTKNDAVKTLIKYINEVEDGDKTNREGLAAKLYFQALFGNDFIRGEDDLANHLLNYGYSILKSMISKVLSTFGLNMNIGIFHRSKTNSVNLCYDIIEVFRPIVDSFVIGEIKNNIEIIDKKKYINYLTQNFILNGMKQRIITMMERYVKNVLDFLSASKDYEGLTYENDNFV